MKEPKHHNTANINKRLTYLFSTDLIDGLNTYIDSSNNSETDITPTNLIFTNENNPISKTNLSLLSKFLNKPNIITLLLFVPNTDGFVVYQLY